MCRLVFKALALMIALAVALLVGAMLGGGIIYALTQFGGAIPVARAEGADPGYGIVIGN